MTPWTDVPKPTGDGTVTIQVGMATGLLTPPTYAVEHEVEVNTWVDVPKPTN